MPSMGINGLPFKLGPGRGGGRADDENESVTSCARIETLRASLSLSLSLSFSLIERRKNRGQTSRRLNWARSNLKGPCAYFPLPLSGSIEAGAFDSNSSKYPSPLPPSFKPWTVYPPRLRYKYRKSGREGGGRDRRKHTVNSGNRWKTGCSLINASPNLFYSVRGKESTPSPCLRISLSLSPKFNRCSCYEIARDRAIFRFSRISRLFYTCNSRIFGRIGATRSLQSRAPRPPIPPRARGEGRSHSSPTPSLPFQVSRFGAVNEQRSYSWHAPPEGRTSRIQLSRGSSIRVVEPTSSRSYPSSPSPSTFAFYMYISRACFDDRVFVTPRLVARVVSRFESRGIKPLPICRRKAYE